jgi:hypothetical protein
MQRSEKCRSTRKVALGLYNSRFRYERIQVVRCDIENLIKLSQRFGETAKRGIGAREWVELHRAFQFRDFALVLADVCERVIGEPLTRRRVVRI